MNDQEARLQALERRFEELLRRYEALRALLERDRQTLRDLYRGT